MIRISQIKLKAGHTQEDLSAAIRRKARGARPKEWHIVKKSIDARKKPDIYYSYTIDASFSNEHKIIKQKNSGWSPVEKTEYQFPGRNLERLEESRRPVIIGAGPAGLFAGLLLARNGFAPVIYERGDSVEVREKKVETFFREGILDEESNVQFGEGGAGTFSDGKLNTVVKDKIGRNRLVLEEFVRHGAPEEILYEAKPHIGTDILKDVVASIREEIKFLGGEIFFRTKAVKIQCGEENGQKRITGIRLETVQEKDTEKKVWERACDTVIFAVGHSARDTFSMLYDNGVYIRPKSFAVGVRVEHPAKMINESQYGKAYPKELSAASYKLTHQCADGRGIYSFCMCPGGYVVNSSSEKGRLCVNGMSYHKRDGKNSNSAIITTVTPEDFGSGHPLAGIWFQRRYEELAFRIGSGKIPVQLYGDFRENRISRGFGAFESCTKGERQFVNLRECLPEYIIRSLLEGMEAFGKRIEGYDREDAIFSGVETRTSSPLRIERSENGEANIQGFFPCGEGAGYAGGITSAAMDGIKAAEAAAKKILRK